MVDKRLRRRTPVRIKQIRGVADELASWIGQEVSLDGRWRVGPVILGAAMGLRQLSVLATTLSVGVDL